VPNVAQKTPLNASERKPKEGKKAKIFQKKTTPQKHNRLLAETSKVLLRRHSAGAKHPSTEFN